MSRIAIARIQEAADELECSQTIPSFWIPPYCDGIICSEAFLGPIPSMYRQVRLRRQDNLYYPGFENLRPDETQLEDLRPPALPAEWKEVSREENAPYLLYRNIETGEARNWFADPRCDTGALEHWSNGV